jgi:sugar (pentulose or hexulose) kinase
VLDNLVTHGFELRRLTAGGGGARSRLWMGIHADVLGRPIQRAGERVEEAEEEPSHR